MTGHRPAPYAWWARDDVPRFVSVSPIIVLFVVAPSMIVPSMIVPFATHIVRFIVALFTIMWFVTALLTIALVTAMLHCDFGARRRCRSRRGPLRAGSSP